MKEQRFDALTRSLTRGASRRGTIRLLVGGALGGLLTDFGAPHAGAMHFDCRHVGKRCRHGQQCCSGRCRGPKGHKTCRAHDVSVCKSGQDSCSVGSLFCGSDLGCRCFTTTGDAGFCGTNPVCSGCTRDVDCEGGSGPGAACVICPTCGGADATACIPACA